MSKQDPTAIANGNRNLVGGHGGISSGVIFTNRSFGSANALFPVIILLKYSPASFVVNTFIGLSLNRFCFC